MENDFPGLFDLSDYFGTMISVSISKPEHVVIGHARRWDGNDILLQQVFDFLVDLGVALVLGFEARRVRRRLVFIEERFMKNWLRKAT